MYAFVVSICSTLHVRKALIKRDLVDTSSRIEVYHANPKPQLSLLQQPAHKCLYACGIVSGVAYIVVS